MYKEIFVPQAKDGFEQRGGRMRRSSSGISTVSAKVHALECVFYLMRFPHSISRIDALSFLGCFVHSL